MQDVVDTGLTYKSQWERLVDTATSPEQVVKEFKATAALLDGLKPDPVASSPAVAPPVAILPAFYQPPVISVPVAQQQQQQMPVPSPSVFVPPQPRQVHIPPPVQQQPMWNAHAPRMVVSSLVAQPQKSPTTTNYDYHMYSSARAQQPSVQQQATATPTNNGPKLKSRRQPVGVLE